MQLQMSCGSFMNSNNLPKVSILQAVIQTQRSSLCISDQPCYSDADEGSGHAAQTLKGKNIHLGIGLAASCTSNFAYAFIPNLFNRFCGSELESIVAFKVLNMFC